MSETAAALHIPRSFREYFPGLALQLEAWFPKLRFEETTFDNLMPLLLAGEVPHAVMLWLMNGDNWQKALVDLFNAHVLTQNIDKAGPNVDRLGIFASFIDLRQDQKSRKPVSGRPKGEMAIVKAQGSWSKALANMMKYVAGVDYLVNLDGHSHLATTHFQEVGIEVINVTTAFVMLEEIKSRGLLNEELENMICGVDFGNLALVEAICQRMGMDYAIIRKQREAINGGVKTETTHELVYGDVRGKRVVLMDDMISSGGTLIKTVKLLIENGAEEILVCATHPVFAPREYYENLQELLKIDKVKIVMTTNSLPLKRAEFGGDRSLAYIKKKKKKPQKVAGAEVAGEAVVGESAAAATEAVAVHADQPVEAAPTERRQVEMLDIDRFVGIIIQAMMHSSNTDDIRATLKEHVVVQDDPYAIYERLTGRHLDKPVDVGVYREGEFEMFEE